MAQNVLKCFPIYLSEVWTPFQGRFLNEKPNRFRYCCRWQRVNFNLPVRNQIYHLKDKLIQRRTHLSNLCEQLATLERPLKHLDHWVHTVDHTRPKCFRREPLRNIPGNCESIHHSAEPRITWPVHVAIMAILFLHTFNWNCCFLGLAVGWSPSANIQVFNFVGPRTHHMQIGAEELHLHSDVLHLIAAEVARARKIWNAHSNITTNQRFLWNPTRLELRFRISQPFYVHVDWVNADLMWIAQLFSRGVPLIAARCPSINNLHHFSHFS